MKPSEYARLREILAGEQSIATTLIKYPPSGREFRLKAYSINVNDPPNPKLDAKTIYDIVGRGGIEKHSGIGIAIASPSFLEAYERFYSVNMWKNDIVDDKEVYKHVSDNNLAATMDDGTIFFFVKTSDNMCALEFPIMAEEGKLWKQVILGKKSLEQYLHEFVKVV